MPRGRAETCQMVPSVGMQWLREGDVALEARLLLETHKVEEELTSGEKRNSILDPTFEEPVNVQAFSQQLQTRLELRKVWARVERGIMLLTKRSAENLEEVLDFARGPVGRKGATGVCVGGWGGSLVISICAVSEGWKQTPGCQGIGS